MTAFSDLDSAVAAFQGAPLSILAKPFDLDKAVELIRRALEESLRETESEQQFSETPEILGQAPRCKMFSARLVACLSRTSLY
jgi:two-component system nitrogen regulation response regulator GlnG